MTFIKVLFILMLLAPVAYLMRQLLRKISSQTPAQTDSNVPVDVKKSSRGEASGRKGNRKGRKKSGKGSRASASGEGGSAGDGSGSGADRSSSAKDRDTGAGGKQTGRTRGAATGRSTTVVSDGSYTPRQPEQWQRSERVPFGEAEGYHVDPPQKNKRPIAENPSLKQWKKPSDAVRERNEEANRAGDKISRKDNEDTVAFEKEEKATKKRKRSDRSPSKRQLRKNRERARKRDMKKRKEEDNS